MPQAESFAADAGVTLPQRLRRGRRADDATSASTRCRYTYFLDADGAVAYTQVGPVDLARPSSRALVAEHLGVQL